MLIEASPQARRMSTNSNKNYQPSLTSDKSIVIGGNLIDPHKTIKILREKKADLLGKVYDIDQAIGKLQFRLNNQTSLEEDSPISPILDLNSQ